jgi:Fe-S cluster assembly protein SufB
MQNLNQLIISISQKKNEPSWMLELRLKALECYNQMPMPSWGADLSKFEEKDLQYYINPTVDLQYSWEQVPADIKKTFADLGILEAEHELLAGVGAQYDSELIYKSLKTQWLKQGVIFSDISQALLDYPELVKKYFATVISYNDNKFASLNSAAWSGGSFVYVPSGVHVTVPLQAYFRINSPTMGQFERTLIIAEKDSSVHYIEGCSAPLYRKNSLHSAVVEVIALEGAKVRYTTIQNWSNNIFNLVTKRAHAYANSCVEWVDGNFGSCVTMKYPCVVLKGENARANIISLAVAGQNQHQDAGTKIIHCADNTKSNIISKSISKNGGRASYRGLVAGLPTLKNCQSAVKCDALLFADSRSDTYPTIKVKGDFKIEHEASVSNISEEQIFYSMCRGIMPERAQSLVVNGFVGTFLEELPLEYALEINKLIANQMEGSIG